MKKLICVSVVGLAFASGAANADEGFSVGASVGNAQIEVDDGAFDFDGNDLGWKLFGAYQFNEFFAIEGGYIDFGEPDDTVLGIDVEAELDGFQAYAVGIYPASENFDLFGKLGAFAWDSEASAVGGSFDDDGTDLALGFGGRYEVNDQFGIRGEFEWFDIDDSDAVWMLSIGGEIRFK